MDFDLNKYVSSFDVVRTQERLESTINNNEWERKIARELFDIVTSTHDGVVIIIGPNGAGKSTLSARLYEKLKSRNEQSNASLQANPIYFKGEFAELIEEEPRWFFDRITDRKCTLVLEAHPDRLIYNDLTDFFPKPVFVVERPFLRDDLVDEILETAFDFPNNIRPQITETVAGSISSLKSIIDETGRLQSINNRVQKQQLVYLETDWQKFARRDVENYMTYHIGGNTLQNIAITGDSTSIPNEHIKILIRMGLLKLENDRVRLRSIPWADAIKRYHEEKQLGSNTKLGDYVLTGDYFPFRFGKYPS